MLTLFRPSRGKRSQYLTRLPDLRRSLTTTDLIAATCPFCDRLENGPAPVVSAELAVAFEDVYPVSPGHTLIVSRRHVERLRDLAAEECRALWDLVPAVRGWLERLHEPDGYNIGMNDGAVAGQTVPHIHLHVIPRYAGDSSDPRGGVRWVIPERAAYWQRPSND